MRTILAALALILCGGAASAMEMGGPGSPEAGGLCGGMTGAACAAGEYCDYPVEARCGAADQQGMCRPVPDLCTQQYDPVCGCDGETYGNACEAASAGIAVASRGACS